MADANERLLDATLRHAVDLRRYTTGEVAALLEILERSDKELVAKLRRDLRPTFTRRRLKRLLEELRATREAAWREFRARVRRDMRLLGRDEIAAEAAAVRNAIPFKIELAAVPAAQLREALFNRAFQGRDLGEWFASLEAADRRRIADAVQLGMAQGETVDQITRRVAGTRAAKFRDGALGVTRRQAQTVIVTAINHSANAARELMHQANDDVIAGLRVNATLDGRTSPVCRARDGKVVMFGDRPVPEGMKKLVPAEARPPFHPRCRTLMVAILDGVGLLGKRPFVVDKRRPSKRVADFRREARRTGRPIQQIREDWARANIGTVPADVTYDEWLRRQPTAFQNDVLGSARGAAFRSGARLDQFVSRSGDTLNLSELRARGVLEEV